MTKVVKADRRLLQRLFNAANAGRSVEIAEVLKHELSPVPLSLTNCNGVMNSTVKSQILTVLSSQLNIVTPQSIPDSDILTCVIIDGHALIQSLGKPHGCQTFGDYADVFVQSVNKHFRTGCTRVDVTFDRYLGQQSIKASTRSKRTSKRRPIRKLIDSPDVPLPEVWDQYIALGQNKADLAEYLSTELIQRADTLTDGGCEVVAGGGFPNPDNARSNIRDVKHLSVNHEEADTRMIVHAMDAVKLGYKRLLVMCRDTDVLLLLLYHLGALSVETWMISGTAKQRKCFPVHEIASHLDPAVIHNILGFHALTGCDTTSSFHGIGKMSCWKKYSECPELLEAVGRDGDTSGVQTYLCQLYGCSGVPHEPGNRYLSKSTIHEGPKSPGVVATNRGCPKAPFHEVKLPG